MELKQEKNECVMLSKLETTGDVVTSPGSRASFSPCSIICCCICSVIIVSHYRNLYCVDCKCASSSNTPHNVIGELPRCQ